MRATLSSIPFGTTLRCATVELIEDISVPYRINAIASHEDLASALRAGESEGVINKGSSSGAQKPANTTYASHANPITGSPENRGEDLNEHPTTMPADEYFLPHYFHADFVGAVRHHLGFAGRGANRPRNSRFR